jgi:hypothetical protein
MSIPKVGRRELKNQNTFHASMVNAKKSRLRAVKRDSRGYQLGMMGRLAPGSSPVCCLHRRGGTVPLLRVSTVPLSQTVRP